MKAEQYDIISLHNIDNEPFTFEYGKSEGNPPHTIPAGEVRRYPRFLAKHALKHLINKLLNKKGEKTNHPVLREELANQIVVGEEGYHQEKVLTEAEKTTLQVEKLNKPSDLEAILTKHRAQAKRKKEEEKKQAVTPETPAPPKETEKFEGLELEKRGVPILEDKKAPEVKEPVGPPPPASPTPSPAKEEKTALPVPTKKEIYQYARTKMGMTIDEKDQKVYDKMSVSMLLTELGDPRDLKD